MDLSPQEDQAYFCDGLADELINRLTKIENLKVPARTSSFSFKGKELDIQEIGEKLDDQFDDQARKFLTDSTKFRLDRAKKRVYVSQIFDWFGKDFVSKYYKKGTFQKKNKVETAVLRYISMYLDEKDQDFLKRNKIKIKYLDYDWSLNEQ